MKVIDIEDSMTGVYKNKNDQRKYRLTCKAESINGKIKNVTYFFKCIDPSKGVFHSESPYKIDINYLKKMISFGHFKKLKQK